MRDSISKKSSDIVEVVGKALKVLELFDGSGATIRLRDVSSALRVSPSSAHRLLASLSHYGYVHHDARAHVYVMGDALLALARSLQYEVTLREGAQRELRRLIARTNGSTCFAVLRDAHAYVVDVQYRPGSLARPAVGYTAPLTTTASGRALLAASPEDFAALVRAKRVRAAPAFMREIEDTRRRGFASSFGETARTVTAVASAIVSSSGRVHGALDVLIFGEPISRDRLITLGDALRASCARVAGRLP